MLQTCSLGPHIFSGATPIVSVNKHLAFVFAGSTGNPLLSLHKVEGVAKTDVTLSFYGELPSYIYVTLLQLIKH